MNTKIYSKIILTTFFSLAVFLAPSFSFASLVNKTISQTLTSGLLGHWTMDQKDATWSNDTTGTILDRSGNGNTGTFTNMSRAISQVVGKIGQGMKFDGTNDSVIMGQVSSVTSTGTISLWVKTTNTGVNLYLAGNGNWTTDRNGINLGQGSSAGRLCIELASASSAISSCVTNGFNDGKWHHIIATWDGSLVKMYQDNVSIITPFSQTLNPVTNVNNFTVGKDPANSNYFFNGSIDDVRIYNRALSATEITQLYQLGASKYNATPTLPLTSGLAGWWTMDGKDSVWTSSTAGTVIDKSGNGKTGTFTNMTRSSAQIAGKIGQGIKFDGSNDYITNSTSLVLTGEYSISAWIFSQNAVSSNKRAIAIGDSTNLIYANIALNLSIGVSAGTHAIHCTQNTLSGGQTVSKYGLANGSMWHHVVCNFIGPWY